MNRGVTCGNLGCFLLLWKHGASLAELRFGDETLLMAAAKAGNIEVVSFLVRHGADVNVRHADAGSALTYAARSGNVATLQYLLDHGCRPDKKALIAASDKDQSKMVELLLAKLNPTDRDVTTLQQALWATIDFNTSEFVMQPPRNDKGIVGAIS